VLQLLDVRLEPTVTEVGRALESGSLEALEGRGPDQPPGIVIGRDLATRLGAFAGDSLTLVTQEGTLTPMGYAPGRRRFEVVGVYSLGLYEFDNAYGFISIDVARRIFDRDRVDFIELKVDDIYAAPAVADDIQRRFGATYMTQDWADLNQSLFEALWIEKYAIALTIGLIVMVAALNIVASLVLLVMEKHRDIAILKTMGASARSITVIFLLQGTIIGVVGTFVGATAGAVIARVLDRYRLITIPSDVYQVSYLPFTLLPWDLFFVVAGAILVCFVATLYPSRQAARLDPAQALRYE